MSESMHTQSILKFVPSSFNGLPQKRARTQRACERCRKRKKRCDHTYEHDDTATVPNFDHTSFSLKRARRSFRTDVDQGFDNAPDQEAPLEWSPLGEHQVIPDGSDLSLISASRRPPVGAMDHSGAEHQSQPHPDPYESESEDESRFVGHLNPEGTFLAATSPTQTIASGEREDVGVWLSARAQWDKRKPPSGLRRRAQSHTIYCSNPLISTILLPDLEESCLSLLPIESDLDALKSIYFDQIHPIFPIPERKGFDESPHNTAKIVMNQAICLLASASTTAKPFMALEINQNRMTLERKDFTTKLFQAVQTSLNLGLIKDKIALCQIYALLSLSMQLADDRHLSAELCARAVAYAQTLGVHLADRTDQPNTNYFPTIFCYIWALDKLNATFHGRPVLMHPRDFGRDLEASISAQEGCFQLLLRTTLLLDKVIDLYRPKKQSAERDWGPNFPDFESIVNDAGALRVKPNLLATIEILYHAVAILSYRSQSIDQRRSPSYVRQSLSASSVISMVAEDDRLSPLPILPYAVSLALRFFYREFRFTKVPLFRARAQKQLVAGCRILRKLGEAFGVAASIATLVEQTLNETDKVYSSLVQSCEQERSGAAEPEVSASAGLPGIEQRTAMTTETMDPSVWDNVPEFDIFEHFDPNFDLNAIDAALADDTQSMFPMLDDIFATSF